MNNSTQTSNGSSAPASMQAPLVQGPDAAQIAAVAIDALRTIGQDVQRGIASLERLAQGSPVPGPLARTRDAATPAGGDQLASVLAALQERMARDPAAASALRARGGQTGTVAGRPATPAFAMTASTNIGPYPTQPPTYAEAFWWGFHVVIPHEAMQWLDVAFGSGLIANAAALGAVIGPTLSVPVAGWVLAALFVYLMAEWGLCHACDKGNGIYLSMTWIAPGIFVPTTR